MTTTMMTRMTNGLDMEKAEATVAAIQADPSLGRFQFRACNRWVTGGENRSTIRGFYGAGQEDESRSADFVYVNGEPPVLLGDNEGANPVEYLLHALAGCVTTTLVLHAAVRGISIRSIESRLEGDIDVQGLLGLDETVSPGYEAIRMHIDIDADCSDSDLDALMEAAQRHSPVCNTVCRPVPVTLSWA
jgi:uncharacterized OsmC-like protein